MPRKRRKRQIEARDVQGDEISILAEVEYIVARARARDARLVSLGLLVFFSTDSGDAWLLDAEDSLALCLARDGTPLPASITETPERFAVEWENSFQIAGDLMTFTDGAGQSRTIFGYPTRDIAEAVRAAGAGNPGSRRGGRADRTAGQNRPRRRG